MSESASEQKESIRSHVISEDEIREIAARGVDSWGCGCIHCAQWHYANGYRKALGLPIQPNVGHQDG